ncbi:MAG: DUF5123 domain-containing protein [Prevotella sp.]
MKKRLTKFRVMSLAVLTLLLSLLTGTANAYDFTLQTNSSTFSASGDDFVATSNGVTFTYAKGGYTSSISGGVVDNQLRVYKDATLTINSPVSITNITINAVSNKNIAADGLVASEGTYTVSTDKLTGTWEGSAKTITFTASGGQTRITSIVVTLNDAELPVKIPSITADTYFVGSTNVTLACETEGASIYYTTNGEAATATNGTLYDGNPFVINATTTVRAIAVKDADTSFENQATFTAVDAQADLASVNALANGTLFAFTGDATVVANPDNKNVYIKDANSFSLIYDSKATTTFPIGTKITPNWIGKISIYNGLVEIVPVSELVAAEGEPAVVTHDEAIFADVVEANINKVVVFKGLTYTLGTGKNITFKEGEATAAGYNNFSLAIDEPIEGDTYDVIGAIGIYNNTTLQIWPLLITRVPKVIPVSIDAETGSDLAALVTTKEEEIIAGGDMVGDITITLAADGAYTMSTSIEAPAAISIVGDANAPATIDASALATSAAPVVYMSITPAVAANEKGFFSIGDVVFKNVNVKGLATQLFYCNKQKYLMPNLTFENGIIQVEGGSKTIFDYNGGGVTGSLNIVNSTIYANPKHGGALYSSQSGQKATEAGLAKQTISIHNSTLYNIAYDKNVNNHRQSNQTWLEYDVKNNIVLDCGKRGQFIKGLNGGQNGANPTWLVDGNTFLRTVEGDIVNVGAEESTGDANEPVANSLVTDPTFTDTANGDFHVFCGSQQAKYKTGDPRWLVEYDAAQALAIPVVISPATDSDITTALNEAKANIDKVGDITINLAADGVYTVSGSLEAPAAIAIIGSDANKPATINAAGLKTETTSAPFILLDGTSQAALKVDGTESDAYKYIENVAVSNVVINALPTQLVRDNQKTLVNTLSVENVQAEFVGSSNIFDFNGKGYPANLSVNNSTLWSKDGHTGYLLQSSGRVKDLDSDQTSYKQIVSLTNSTLYKISVEKQLNNMNGRGQTSLELTMKNVILAECTQNGSEVRGWLGGQNSTNPTVVYENNTYWKDGAIQTGWIDSSKLGYDQTGTYLITEPVFAYADGGDFTLALNTLQNKLRTGDPRWLDVFVADDVTEQKALLFAEIQTATALLGDADVDANANAKALKDAIDKAQGVYDTADLNEVIKIAIEELKAAEAAYISTGINEVNTDIDAQGGAWFTTQGVRISQPTQNGVYIHNGKKIMISNK